MSPFQIDEPATRLLEEAQHAKIRRGSCSYREVSHWGKQSVQTNIQRVAREELKV